MLLLYHNNAIYRDTMHRAGTPWQEIDPLKAEKAVIGRINNGMSSRQIEARLKGYSFENIIKDSNSMGDSKL